MDTVKSYDKEIKFTKQQVERYVSDGTCPNCGSAILEQGISNTTSQYSERKVECISCGIVFYSKYKFYTLEFDGWKYGKDFANARRGANLKGKDICPQQFGRSDGDVDAQTKRSKRSALGNNGRQTKRKRKAKRKATGKKSVS